MLNLGVLNSKLKMKFPEVYFSKRGEMLLWRLSRIETMYFYWSGFFSGSLYLREEFILSFRAGNWLSSSSCFSINLSVIFYELLRVMMLKQVSRKSR